MQIISTTKNNCNKCDKYSVTNDFFLRYLSANQPQLMTERLGCVWIPTPMDSMVHDINTSGAYF